MCVWQCLASLERKKHFTSSDPRPDIYSDIASGIPVVPHKGVAEVSKIGNL
jgi:hypothetical protein